ncbi:hypothetical protein GPL15_22360 [Clostridium sp. MCC353]|uniref:hypothetical protein n=1 Tax=Clostridium sp. MCC353 TaxID=2592646 RepID=UPI001C01F482|nr:hypothetical protein [Clostridium sp. MCC353]MBT9779225.1 hypothetical protein [Clostridium sp. MCC353]
MRKSLFTVLMLAAGMAAAASQPVFAGEWKQDYVGCWYDNGNGTYPADTWRWIDGDHNGVAERYYFDENGYCVKNSVTPDGCQVDCDGAWIQDGLVQIRYIGINSYDEATKEALSGFINEIYGVGMPFENDPEIKGEPESVDDPGVLEITGADLGPEERAAILYWYQSLYGRSTDCRFISVPEKEGTYNRVSSDVLDEVLYEILGSSDNDDALSVFADPANGYVNGGLKEGMYSCTAQRDKENPEYYLKTEYCRAEKEVACLSGEVMVYRPETEEYEYVQDFKAYFTENHNSNIAGFRFERLVIGSQA